MSTATKQVTSRLANFEPFIDGIAFVGMTVKTPRKTEADRIDHFGYFVSRIDSCFGMGFRMKKAGQTQDGEDSEYYQNLDFSRGHTCECKGHLRHGHCKHVEALLALIQAGKIDVPAMQQQAAPEPIEFDDP